MQMLLMLCLLIVAVVANLVSARLGIAVVTGTGRSVTWLATLGLLALALVVAGYAVRKRWDGIFIDRENRISLARFQLVLWTVLLVSALLTAGLINVVPLGDQTPLDIRIPPEVWGMLGLGTFTAVAAPAIKEAKRTETPEPTPQAVNNLIAPAPAPTEAAAAKVMASQNLNAAPHYVGRVMVKDTPEDARWIDMIHGDYEGGAIVDMSKVQQLAFTLLLVAIYGTGLWATMLGAKPVDSFPELGAGFIALLGISHAAYLADKQLGAS